MSGQVWVLCSGQRWSVSGQVWVLCSGQKWSVSGQPLPSGGKYRAMRARTSRFHNRFYPQALRFF